MKIIIDSCDAKCENGLKGVGVTAQKIKLVISRFGPTKCSALLKISEIILTCHKALQKVFKFCATNNNCFHICDKKKVLHLKCLITFVVKCYNIHV